MSDGEADIVRTNRVLMALVGAWVAVAMAIGSITVADETGGDRGGISVSETTPTR